LELVKPTDIGLSAKQAKNGAVDILVENEQQAAEMAKKCLLYFQGPLANEKKRVKKADKKSSHSQSNKHLTRFYPKTSVLCMP
jgi:acetyl-CoA carboxylase carboxyltransferase component